MPDSPASPEPVVLMVSPTGARRTKADHPHLAMTAAEIGRAAAASAAAGASMIHLHVRDRDGRHTLDPDAYRTAIKAIERECGADQLAIQVTTEAAGCYQWREQEAAVRELRPRAVSVAVREIVPFRDTEVERDAAAFAAWAAREKIAVQWIVYAENEIVRYLELRDRGILPDAPHTSLMLVCGRYDGTKDGEPGHLLPFLATMPGEWEETPWMACAFGGRENACVTFAASMHGHVRVGFENNLHMEDGRVAPGVEALVRQAAASLPRLGFRPATVDEAQALFGG